MQTEEAVQYVEAWHDDFKNENKEALKEIITLIRLGAVARKYWNVLLVAVKRWAFVHKNKLPGSEPSTVISQIVEAEKAFGEALKQAGL